MLGCAVGPVRDIGTVDGTRAGAVSVVVDGASGAGERDAHSMRDALYGRVFPPLAALLIRGLRSTWTVRAHGREVLERFAAENQRYVHVFWHAHILLGIYSYVGPKIVVMISRHRDGELIARTVERFGYLAARGSTTEGGSAAFREMVHAVRAGMDICFTPDGPRGPARKVQPGTIAAARALGIPIVPVVGGADRAWRLNSWDRFVVPKPRARVLLACGEPLVIARGDGIEEGTARLERAMEALGAFADANAADLSVGKPVGRLAGGRVR